MFHRALVFDGAVPKAIPSDSFMAVKKLKLYTLLILIQKQALWNISKYIVFCFLVELVISMSGSLDKL